MWVLGLYCLLVVLIVAGILAASAVLGPRHAEPATGTPFESGIVGAGPQQVRMPLHFYLIAMFFVVFDLESVFLFAWAVAARPLGWPGYAEVVVFTAILLASLFYLWRSHALDWAEMRGTRMWPATKR